MKSVFLSLILLLTTAAAQAGTAEQCLKNSYALTKANLVIAKDGTDSVYATVSAREISGEFYFNQLRDHSCITLEFVGKKVICVSFRGERTHVGDVQNLVGRFTDWNFYKVNWSPRVVIKAGVDRSACIYGMAVQ